MVVKFTGKKRKEFVETIMKYVEEGKFVYHRFRKLYFEAFAQ